MYIYGYIYSNFGNDDYIRNLLCNYMLLALIYARAGGGGPALKLKYEYAMARNSKSKRETIESHCYQGYITSAPKCGSLEASAGGGGHPLPDYYSCSTPPPPPPPPPLCTHNIDIELSNKPYNVHNTDRHKVYLLHCSRDHTHPPQVKSLLHHPSPAADDGFVG